MSERRIYRINKRLYDFGTPNKSFLNVASILKKKGIQNYYFMLEIMDPSLIHVDPYSVDSKGSCNLSKDQISRVMAECLKNPWYYLRELSRIPDAGGDGVHYLANRGNIAQAWCILHGLDSWLDLVRQQGKTESAIAIEGWAYNFGTSNTTFIFVNKSGDDTKENLRRLQSQLRLLPEYLQFDSIIDEETGKREKKQESATRMRNPITKNMIRLTAKATSYDAALKLARGLSASIIHYDECEFTDFIDVIVKNSVSTYSRAAENAIKNGSIHARIFTSTPGDLDTPAGSAAQKLLDKTIPWTEKLYDWDKEKIEKYITSQGSDSNRILYIEYGYQAIGRTRKWFENIAAQINDPLVVRREILLQRLHGSNLSPFPREDIEYIIEMQKEPIEEMWLLDFYLFNVYTKLDKRKPYLAGIDCSTGTNADNNAITILDPFTKEPVAEFECSYIGETKFEQLLIALVDELPRIVLCIERNSVGDAIIDHLLHSRIASNLYYDKNRDLVGETMKHNESVESMLKKEASLKTYYGVYTEGNSREAMFSILSRHVNEYKEKFVTKNITRDLSRLVRTASGKIVAGTGKDESGESFHDDSIMSYLIALYVLYHGNNLLLFGIALGAKDEELNNSGLKRPNEIDPTLVDKSLIDAAQKNENQKRSKEQYEAMVRKALMEAQRSSMELHKKGLVENQLFNNTAENEYYDDPTIDQKSYYSMIDSLNGLNQGFSDNQNNDGFSFFDPFSKY